MWNALPGPAQRKTPLSDHLHDLFKEWVSDYLFVANDFTRLFEEFEILGALAHLTMFADHESIRKSFREPGFTWCPMGRAIWDGQTRAAMFEKWNSVETAQLLLDAGFARKSNDYLTDAIKNLEKHCSWA